LAVREWIHELIAGEKMNESIERNLRRSFEVARQARDMGNDPFGAVLADASGKVLLEGENTIVTRLDITGHAETNLVREASKRFDESTLANCTLYASSEPCPMCAGAIYWSGIGRVVYGLSQKELYQGVQGKPVGAGFLLSFKDVIAHADRAIEVIGPLLEAEAREVHEGFWVD
jgi:tRNA(Arg) A34 adenosine deaminase TadA